MGRVRYPGTARNNCHLQFVACAMNMKRALVLLAAWGHAGAKCDRKEEMAGK